MGFYFSTRSRTLVNIFSALVFVCFLVMIFRASTSTYSPDSWSYVAIANNLMSSGSFQDPLDVSRNFTATPWTNNSFPYLWPVLLAPGIAIFGPTLPVGALVNSFVWLATAVSLALLTRQSQRGIWPGLMSGLALLGIPGYVNEISSGRSIPLTILLLISGLLLIIRIEDKFRGRRIVFAFFLFGLAAANRFDALIFGPLIGVVCFWLYRPNIRLALTSILAWLIPAAVYPIYSLFVFGRIMFTENSYLLADPNLQNSPTYYPLKVEAPALEMFTIAFSRFYTNTSKSLNFFDGSSFSQHVGVVLIILFVPGLIFLLKKLSEATSSSAKDLHVLDSVKLLSWICLATLIVVWITHLITGYTDIRYWATPLALLILLFCAGQDYFNSLLRSIFKPTMLAGTQIALSCTLLIMGSLQLDKSYSDPISQSTFDSKIVSCVGSNVRVAFIQSDNSGPGRGAPYRIGATTSVNSSAPPSNMDLLTMSEWDSLSKDYRIQYWVNLSSRKTPEAAKKVFQVLDCRDALRN